MRRGTPGQPIETQPDILTAILAVDCPTCGAGPTGVEVTWHHTCWERERPTNNSYVVPPHLARVQAAGFRIVRHPTDDGVRWYEPLNQPDISSTNTERHQS